MSVPGLCSPDLHAARLPGRPWAQGAEGQPEHDREHGPGGQAERQTTQRGMCPRLAYPPLGPELLPSELGCWTSTPQQANCLVRTAGDN